MIEHSAVQKAFEADWMRLDDEERTTKVGNHRLVELQKIYTELSLDERQAVDLLLATRVVGDDTRKQFDAEGIINHFGIRSTLPTLYSERYAISSARDAPNVYRREKLDRLIERLESQ